MDPSKSVEICPELGTVLRGTLCAICHRLFFGEDAPLFNRTTHGIMSFDHHQSFSSLEDSAGQGCFLCTLVADRARKLMSNVSKAITHTKAQISGGNLFSIYIHSDNFVADALGYRLDYKADSFETLRRSTATLSRAWTGDPGVLKLVKSWLEQCLDTHAGAAQRKTTWYPKRLLDLSQKKIRLVRSATYSPKDPYVTLSHCWGTKPFLVLDTENEAWFEAGVDISVFPSSFQDVMSVSRVLGIRYLWIDCYCIVQSEETKISEWTTESATMRNTYENGILNIGVANASSPYEGCFRRRDTSLASAFQIAWHDREESTSIYRLSQEPSPRPSDILRQPLFKRAWVLQERLLCQRMLHFGDDGIYWECCGNDSVRSELSSTDSLFEDSGLVTPFEYRTRPGKTWDSIVEAYSRTQLTKPQQDKFVALAGIAELVSCAHDDTYCAGLFRNCMVDQLCWAADPNYGTRPGRAKEWRAPTWSWASLDQGVYARTYMVTYPKNYKPLASVVSLELNFLHECSVYGALRSASLTLDCRLLIGDISSRREWLKLGDDHVHWIHDDDDELESAPERLAAVPLMLCVGIQYSNPDDSAKSIDIASLDVFKALDLLKGPSDQEWFGVSGIVLREHDDGKYRRLGMFEERHNVECISLMELWLASESQIITLV